MAMCRTRADATPARAPATCGCIWCTVRANSRRDVLGAASRRREHLLAGCLDDLLDGRLELADVAEELPRGVGIHRTALRHVRLREQEHFRRGARRRTRLRHLIRLLSARSLLRFVERLAGGLIRVRSDEERRRADEELR